MAARFGVGMLGLLLASGVTHGQVLFPSTWLGTGTDANWSTAANWQFAVVPTSRPNALLIFGGNSGANTAVTTAVVDAGIGTSGSPLAFELSQLSFGPQAIPYTLSAGAGGPAVRFVKPDVNDVEDIVVQSGRTVASAITFPITTGTTGTHVWTNDGTGGLTVTGPVTISNTGFTIQGSGNTTVNGAIALGLSFMTVGGSGNVSLEGAITNTSGANGISHSGTGTLSLSGANTYSGTTFINSTGTIRLVGGANRLPAGTTVQFNDLGRIDLNGNNQQLGGLTQSGAAFSDPNHRIVNTSATPATFTYAPLFSTSFTGTFGGTGGNNLAFTYSPFFTSSTLTLTAAHTYTGMTTVQGGTLKLSGSGAVANSATLRVNANAVLDINSLTGGSSYDATSGRFLVRQNQVLQGTGTVFGNVLAGPGGIVHGGTGGGTGTLTVNGSLRFQGGGLPAGPSLLRVFVQDTGTVVTSSQLSLTHVVGTGTLSTLDLLVGPTAPVVIDLRDAGGLQYGKAYTITLATAEAIARNGTNVTTSAGGGTFTFDPAEYTLSSPNFSGFNGVELKAVGGQLQLSFTPVPEPAFVVGLAALGLLAVRRRR